ncbi:hypothetical protein, partial [Limosilactobacillus fermentum]|uniref:hypothetical protein n=1 Tax=Limosilactobacillus fermentum TaxID=1613 RepID=UPI002F26004B
MKTIIRHLKKINLKKQGTQPASHNASKLECLFSIWRIVKLSATVCQKILHMGFQTYNSLKS